MPKAQASLDTGHFAPETHAAEIAQFIGMSLDETLSI
jgi:hypothetical protein